MEKNEDVDLIANGVNNSQTWNNGFMRVTRDIRSGGYNDRAAIHQSVTKMPDCCVHDVETLRMHTSSSSMNTLNRETKYVSNTFQYLLITKSIDENVSCSLKARRKSLYEMLTVPISSESHSRKPEFSYVSSSSNGDGEESDKSDAHGIETRSQTSARRATNTSDSYEHQRSAKVLVSDKLHKDFEQPRLLKAHHASNSLDKQEISGDAENEILDANELGLASSESTGITDQRKQGTSRTEVMHEGQALSHVWRPNVSSSVHVKETSSQVEPCSRWLKHLRYNSLYSLQNNTKPKRPRVGDGPSTGETCSLSGKFIEYDTSQSDMMRTRDLMKKRTCDDTNHQPSKMECPAELSLEKVQCWVGRWCCKDTKTTPPQAKPVAALALLSNREAYKSIPDDPKGKQFPSIGAMALIGKMMNNLHTCEFQKRGSSVVWKAKSLES